ncbi:PIR Superfamily Protein [Plasmodium ovale wallikeri]|uniref:PIR Superfamily Protein n=2 Tax=Plasmodium ovale TaxID=36330 RepID=A0A1A9AQV4_PLAOA|nr:PIR Superfamily Protein [Plasmodium ovale wallikeri]SBT59502.1 PIR Superfamily Protein [Plasmodium ovale wallikeri]SBT72909.1 PIR protein [Plasmodium ovale]
MSCDETNLKNRDYPNSLNNLHSQDWAVKNNVYLENVGKINDPILQHIFLYFVNNYEYGRSLYRMCTKVIRHGACQSLNKWLHRMKDMYTYAGKCTSKKNIWDAHINEFIELFKKYDAYKDEVWCNINNDDKFYITTTFPNGFNYHDCNNSVSEVKTFCMDKNPQPDKEDSPSTNACPPCISCDSVDHALNIQSSPSEVIPFHIQDSSSFMKIIISVLSTFLGTHVIHLLLYKYTPIVSWLYSKKLKKKSLGSYINEEYEGDISENSFENNITFSEYGENYLRYHAA